MRLRLIVVCLLVNFFTKNNNDRDEVISIIIFSGFHRKLETFQSLVILLWNDLGPIFSGLHGVLALFVAGKLIVQRI